MFGGFVLLGSESASAQRILREHVGFTTTLQGGQPWGEFLWKAMPVGDLNLDGFDDYALIGRRSRVLTGWYELHSGVDGSLLAPRFLPPMPGGFAATVTPVGDFNGDGRPDLVRTTNDFACEMADALSGQTIASLPAAPYSGYGTHVVALGDINADGYNDIAVSGDDPDGIGIHLGPDGTRVADINTLRGTRIASAGDVNGDGITDLLVGSGFLSRATVVSMADFSVLYHVYPESPCRCAFPFYGFSVAGLSDIDGDGVRDFAVGAPSAGFSFGISGRAFIEFRSGRTGEFIRRVDEPYPRMVGMASTNHVLFDLGKFALKMHSFGDFNGDGYDDLAVSSPDRFELSSSYHGAENIISGLTGEVLVDRDPRGTTSSTRRNFGREVFMLGDLDGDGYAEYGSGYIADDEGGVESGRVWIYRGSPGDAVPHCTAPQHSGGQAAEIRLDGSISLLNENMWLQVYDGLPGEICVFFAAQGAHTAPAGPNGLCLGTRGALRVGTPTVIRQDGLGEIEVDMAALTASGIWTAGSTWTLQTVFRDPGGMPTLGRSNAVTVQWAW
ncbi:MAG: hypothetical protein AAGG01_22975 [Planctomycetota bacterium]